MSDDYWCPACRKKTELWNEGNDHGPDFGVEPWYVTECCNSDDYEYFNHNIDEDEDDDD
jgi:hypothetical protein